MSRRLPEPVTGLPQMAGFWQARKIRQNTESKAKINFRMVGVNAMLASLEKFHLL
jgi:hypothetical protein